MVTVRHDTAFSSFEAAFFHVFRKQTVSKMRRRREATGMHLWKGNPHSTCSYIIHAYYNYNITHLASTQVIASKCCWNEHIVHTCVTDSCMYCAGNNSRPYFSVLSMLALSVLTDTRRFGRVGLCTHLFTSVRPDIDNAAMSLYDSCWAAVAWSRKAFNMSREGHLKVLHKQDASLAHRIGCTHLHMSVGVAIAVGDWLVCNGVKWKPK